MSPSLSVEIVSVSLGSIFGAKASTLGVSGFMRLRTVPRKVASSSAESAADLLRGENILLSQDMTRSVLLFSE